MGSRLSAHEKDWHRYRYYDPFRISQVHHLSVQISIRKGCYMPSVDLVDMYLRLAEKI